MPVTFGPAALADLRGVLAHLATESPRAASAFSAAISKMQSRLAEFPDSGSPIVGRPYRSVMLHGFPYKVLYRRLSGDEVRVVRIRHARRRPLKLS